MTFRRPVAPHFTSRVQLAAVLLVVGYMLLIGGSFDATVRYRVQLLNTLAAGALALIWLGARLWQRARLMLTGLELPVTAFALSQWIAVLASAQPRLSLEAAASVVAWGAAFLILCDLLASGWPREYVTNALLLAAFIVAAQALWEVVSWYGLWARLGQLPPVAFRLTGFLGHPNLTAAVINLLLPLAIARALCARRLAARLALGALGLGMLAVELFSSSRAGWVAGGVMLAVLTILWVAHDRERIRRWALGWWRGPLITRLGTAAAGLSLLAFTGWLLARQSRHATHVPLLSSRLSFWGPAWDLFVTHPLTGAGPDLFAWFYPRSISVPPVELVPHAHSLIFQVLGGSGLLGLASLGLLAVMASVRLWGCWRRDGDRAWTAALMASLLGASVHNLFDYFFGAPAFVFLFLVIAALAFAPRPESLSPRHVHPALMAAPFALVMGVSAFSLRGAAWNEQGVQLAAQNKWAAAGQAFQRAAEADPGLALYWEEAAQSLARAGDVRAAIPLWQRAARDQPYWALPRATLAVLAQDPALMQPALDIAPESDLFELNAGALFEAAGDADAARRHYRRALALKPASARALFWQQTRLRAEALAEWQAAQPADDSPLAQGWAAMEAGEADAARALFAQAHAEAPLSNAPYLGLARAYWALGDEANAGYYLRAGQSLPVYALEETVPFQLLQGDWEEAHGNRTGSMAAYGATFSAYNDYTSAGPGTYGYPWRSWIVFRRAALPSDLVPQFVRADITAEMDARFALLAEWYLEDGQRDTACYVLARVHHEAPISESGKLWQALCS